jgi:hypothetical protein
MALTHTYRFSVTGAGNSSQSFSVPISADGEDNREISLDAGEVNQQVALDLDVSQIKAYFITVQAQTGSLASGTVITLKTNSSGTPAETITITSPGGLAYVASYFGVNVFETDVTTIFLSNSSATQAVNVILWFLVDSTVL